MRHLFLYITILLSVCRVSAHAGKKQYEAIAKKKPVTVLKVVSSHPHSGWHNGSGYSPDTIFECNNPVYSPLKCDSRPGTPHFSVFFTPRLPFNAAQLSTGRLLDDLHAIVRTLIFPKHIFW